MLIILDPGYARMIIILWLLYFSDVFSFWHDVAVHMVCGYFLIIPSYY